MHPEPQKEDAFDASDEPESPVASSRDESFEIADLDDGSGSDEERLEEERREAERVGADLDVDDAIRAYQRALEGGGEGRGREAGSGSDDAEFGSASDSSDVDDVDDVDDAASDSSEEERPQRNTVGAVPLSWYDDEQHIGYDQAGEQILKSRRKDKLDALLEKTDDPTAYRKVYDQYNDEEITLTKEEMRMIQNIRTGRFAHAESMELYPEENDWFSRHKEVMPLSAAPEPKRRFVPSKWEEKKVVKLVRAIRKGWLSTQAAPKAPTVYELWGQADGDGEGQKTLAGLTYLAAPKMVLPGHEESYNPPKEYLLTKEEEMQAKLEAEESELPPPFIPQAFDWPAEGAGVRAVREGAVRAVPRPVFVSAGEGEADGGAGSGELGAKAAQAEGSPAVPCDSECSVRGAQGQGDEPGRAPERAVAGQRGEGWDDAVVGGAHRAVYAGVYVW